MRHQWTGTSPASLQGGGQGPDTRDFRCVMIPHMAFPDSLSPHRPPPRWHNHLHFRNEETEPREVKQLAYEYTAMAKRSRAKVGTRAPGSRVYDDGLKAPLTEGKGNQPWRSPLMGAQGPRSPLISSLESPKVPSWCFMWLLLSLTGDNIEALVQAVTYLARGQGKGKGPGLQPSPGRA